jgi:hypothetical protein
VFLEARRNIGGPIRNEMVQTQWQQTLRRKIGLPVSFSGSLYWSLRCRGLGQFSTDQLSAYSCGCRRTPNDLGLYAEEIDERTGAGRTDAAQAGLGAILGALYQFSRWICRGCGGTDFLPFPLS